MSKEPLTPIKATAISIIAFGSLFIILQYVLPHFVTKSRVEKAAKIARSQDLQTDYCFENIQDWWAKPICIKREVAKDKMAIVYMAISAGRDSLFDTNDDYVSVKTDLNKSKMIGKWAGKRAKEITKGLREGIFTKSKFEDTDGKKEIGKSDKPETKKFNWKFWEKEKPKI